MKWNDKHKNHNQEPASHCVYVGFWHEEKEKKSPGPKQTELPTESWKRFEKLFIYIRLCVQVYSQTM